jgi:Flp pilus assembly protein TadB
MIWLWISLGIVAVFGVLLFAILITAGRQDHCARRTERQADPFSDVDVTATRNGE